MRGVAFPTFAKWRGGHPTVEAHSRGGAGLFGHEAYELASGARLVWSFEVVPMKITDALKFRAFLHSLRGPGGSFTITLPAPKGTTLASGTISGAVSSGASSVVVSGFTPVKGSWLKITTASGDQVVRVVSVSGSTATIRPRVRAAVSNGAAVSHGPVTATMRLIGATPALSLVNGYSKPLAIDCEEFY